MMIYSTSLEVRLREIGRRILLAIDPDDTCAGDPLTAPDRAADSVRPSA
jgi:hypothetical protein